MIKENESFFFLVTHLETDGQYLKIWAQTDQMVIQSVTKMLINLQDKFDYRQNNIASPNNVMPHTHCCARTANNDFARAKILDFRSDGMVLVQFVDYGNVTHIPIHNIRLLDNLQGAEYLFSVPYAATCFILADVMPIGNSWLPDVIKEIRSFLVNNSYQGVYREFNGCKILKFNMLNQDFGTLLVKRNMALFSVPNGNNPQTTPIAPVQGLRIPHQARNSSQENWRVPAAQQVPPPPQKVVKTNSFKAIQLEIGSFHDVRVSYVDQGPCKFSIQLLDSIPYLEGMMKEINSRSHIPLQESPIAGTVCLGQQTHPQRLCRVVLNSPGDNSCKVYYADYGHHETLKFSELYQIPDEFVVPNIFSIRFTLNGISSWTVSQEMKDYFGGVVANKNLKLKVCKGPLSPLTQYCDLYLNGKSVKDILSEVFPESCEVVYAEPKELQIGSKETVMVPFVESTAKFFVQIESDEKLLDDLMQRIEQAAKTAPKLTHGLMRKDMPCIALYDDQRWYRALIQKIIDVIKVSVFYVDYGNEEIVSVNNLRAIPPNLVNDLPKQAIKCSLNGFQFESPNPELIKKFENFVLEERMILQAIDCVNRCYIVDLHDAKYISDPMADVAKKLRATMQPLPAVKSPESMDKYISDRTAVIAKNLRSTVQPSPAVKSPESVDKYPAQHQRSDEKGQSVQKSRVRNKNVKPRENWTGAGNWNKDRESGMIQKTNSFETQENMKSKFRKENENEQRHDNRFRRENSDYQNGPQGNRFASDERRNDRYDQNDRYGKQTENSRFSGGKDYPPNDRFNRSNERNSLESNRMGQDSRGSRNNRSYGSDKDSDTSSRSGGRRNNNRHGRDEPRAREPAMGRVNKIDNWDNERDFATHNKANVNKARTPPENRAPRPDVNPSKITEPKPAPKVSNQIPPPNITSGAVKNCMMVYYNSPTSFYMQLCPDNEQLDIIMAKISSTYNTGGKTIPPSQLKEGLHCIAQWQEDSQWYRAVVKTIGNSSVTVHFIDYGNLETVSLDKIKEIQPELSKLPAQAIHCELFCPGKSDWTKEESDQLANDVDDKELEAEFITAESGVYKVLLKLVKSDKYLNEMFVGGVDLLKEKEAIRNRVKTSARGGYVAPDYASSSDKWRENKVDFGKTYTVKLAWFVNPDSFHFQLLTQEKEFRDMMAEIQDVYAKRQPISEPPKIGAPVLAVLADDGVLYRAEVIKLDKPRGPVVQYVDYGDTAMVDLRHVYPVEKRFMVMPKQAVYCGLNNVAPISGSNWSHATEIGKFFSIEKFECVFHELKKDKYLVSVNANGIDVGNGLVQNGLAVFSTGKDAEKIETAKEESEKIVETIEVPKIDINLLEGQTLLVKVSNVEGVDKFYVQFEGANTCQQNINTYMASKDPKVMPGLKPHEVCLGAGCLISSKGKWRRGVVVNFKKSYYDVRLIDTGEHEKVTLKSMLKLPGQLSAMQNQAVECSLFDVPLSSKADDMLKSLIGGKTAIIFVEKVERNRLIVRLFDVNGNKIKIVGSQNTEKINPICNLPILSSTHEVIVTNLTNSGCLWLQRKSDASIEKQLLDDMYEYYSKLKTAAMAIEKEIFAGLWTDGNWYRMLVLEMKGSDEVKVQLIDYGDTGYILVSDLRTLEPRFFVPHQLAIRVSLTVSLSGSNEEQITLLEPMVKDKTLSATFYNVNRRWIAELSDDNEKLSDKLKAMNVVQETTVIPFEHPEVAEMIVGERYDVTASHVDTPNLIWLQRKEEDEALYDLHDQMQQVADSCPDYEGIPEEKSLCLAIYSLDSCWYRAEVIDADADITTVRFIDYGNTDVVDSSVGRIKQLPDKWKSVKKYAVACKLDVVPANCDDWTEEACARIKELASPENALKVLLIADKAPIRVDLFLDDKSICELLVAEGLAAYIKSSDQMEEELEIVDEEEEQFDPRSAFVSHLVSVDEFWVQEDAKVKDLEMVADRLLMASIFTPLQKIEQGLVCIAHYPEDNQYYRATILSHDEAKGTTRVNYMDYGNSATTEDLKVIPQDLASIPPLSKKCRLAKPDGVQQWPDNVNSEFDKLAANGATVFILDVIDDVGESVLVRMTHNSKDVAMELLQLCAGSQESQSHTEDEGVVVQHSTVAKDIATKERPAPIGEETISSNVCKISCATSPQEFWIQKKTDYVEIENVQKRLSDSEILASVKDLVEGTILAVRYPDDDPQCYRCKILSKTDAAIQVFFIDFGTVTTIHSDTLLRELPEELTHIPALAIGCTLKMPEDLKQSSEAASKKFSDLTENGLAEFRFEILGDTDEPGQRLPVALYLKDQNVVNLLLSSSSDEGVNLHQNTSNDSAIEAEQNLNKDARAHNESDTNQIETAIPPVSSVEENKKADDCDGNEIPVDEDEHKDLIFEEETKIVDEMETKTDEEMKTVDELRISPDQEEKIVPGSISRGISVEDIARFSPVPPSSDPEEKIVPGSINKGDPLKAESVSSQESESPIDKVVAATDDKECEKVSQLVSEIQTISFDDRVVPSCISRGETPTPVDRPMTPKTAHSDKLLAGAVNAQCTLDFEDEEKKLSVEVNQNIPEATL